MTEQTVGKVPQIRFKGFEGHWKEKTLGEITTYKNGKGHEDRQSSRGKYQLINLNSISISGGLKHSGKFIDEAEETLKEDDLVMILSDVAHGNLLGRVARIPENDRFVLNQRVALLRPWTSTSSTYLLYRINARQSYFKLRGAGMSQLNISKNTVTEFTLFSPAENEQTQIGGYFRELDGLIGLHQRKHDKLVKLKKAMLQKMFPQPGTTTPEIRFKGFEGDWVKKALAEISEIKTGPFGSALHAKDYVPDGVPIITTEHFKFWRLPEKKNQLPQISKNDYKRLKNYALKQGDIVFSRVGSVDINAHVEEIQNGWLFSGRVLRVRTPLSIDSEYLHHELSTDRVRKCVTERAVGQTMPSINTGILGGTTVFLPELKTEQQKIGTYFRTLDALITQHATQLQKLQQLKSACLEKMFV